MGRELILKMSISIDGFVAGPNGEMDWMFPSMSEAGRDWVVDLLGRAGLHAMGHRAYHDMSAYWPSSDSPVARPMNEIPKAVFSRSGKVPPPSLQDTSQALSDFSNAAPVGATPDRAAIESWLNPIVGGKDLVADINRLKAEGGGPIIAHGGAMFASSLIAAYLVDLFHLVVHPVAIGRGLQIFAGLESPTHLRLEDLKRFDSGTVVHTYRPCRND